MADALALLKAQETIKLPGAGLTDAEVLDTIRQAPITQKPDDAVRCADCENCVDADRDTPYDGEDEWFCKRWERYVSAYAVDPYQFFCAAGKRRESK